MADFTKFGGTTPRVVIYKSESHKLHQAFPVKASVKIYAGNPVAITADGTIELLTKDNEANYLGIAVTDNNNPAYKESANAGPVEVTVAVQGFMIINAISEAALDAGPVEIGTGMDATNHFTKFKTFTQVDADAATRPVNFISLTKASAKDELIQVLCK
nr:MAG: hypothetical protein [Bacteriophage sp.]